MHDMTERDREQLEAGLGMPSSIIFQPDDLEQEILKRGDLERYVSLTEEYKAFGRDAVLEAEITPEGRLDWYLISKDSVMPKGYDMPAIDDKVNYTGTKYGGDLPVDQQYFMDMLLAPGRSCDNNVPLVSNETLPDQDAQMAGALAWVLPGNNKMKKRMSVLYSWNHDQVDRHERRHIVGPLAEYLTDMVAAWGLEDKLPRYTAKTSQGC
ncbi:MAG: hypothetical protein KJ709_09675 [Nanoarchaeota archaeon]|nr:hypothetical protein [Nanoarchaeota archaeon]